ncbi:KIN17 curved DNA-binding domain protein (macronuclear) [Tetrahymena thermophila SB210]|uniref:KIN17 curved DNA-binding domain protein n=1 Tax=Tetrahymena thermophila (strain SB210) TaxID=312017 RepID=Q23U22_TETTS|nr:KIN17 curved DNA-binding domain protein [Tetrahymena thermophila SB210]EAS00028.1 KIN17 curved DNA-binding domain protein [Tetrahymena thermophila SB210]|eukprot:XP_001020273.1 KIN17 curved DNA-binding domain protein [Tetrahymena thermophila SB210]
MGKAEAGTPKDISNRMKLKGLQKLKFYCQMCKKQCRDQNGFNCHLKSETHLYNMRQFAENPSEFLSTYSKEFENNFMDLLKKRFNQKRVLANTVYKEYIGDKTHVHMNSTKWTTLSGFVMYLHETGKVTADQTDRGLFITYVDKGLEAIKQQREEEKRARLEKKTEKMQQMELERQLQNVKKLEETMNKNIEAKNEQMDELDLEGGQFEFGISFNLKKDEQEDEDEQEEENKDEELISFSVQQQNNQQNQENEQAAVPTENKIENNTQINQQDGDQIQQEGEDAFDEIPWLQEGITVKIKDKELENGSYYNEKAIVKEVNSEDPFQGKIQLIKKPEVVIQMDQQFLETVIPKLEGEVMILKPGQYCKKIGLLKSVIKEKFEGVIQLKEDPSIQLNIPYELFSKI